MKSRAVLEKLSEEFPQWDYFLEFVNEENEEETVLCNVENNEEGYSECVSVREKDGLFMISDWLSTEGRYQNHTFTRESVALISRLNDLIDEEYGEDRYEAQSDIERGYTNRPVVEMADTLGLDPSASA